MSSETMNIYQKLLEVRKSVSYLKKEAESAQYKYTGSAQVLASVRDKINEMGLILVPKILEKNLLTETVEFIEKEKPKKTTTYFTELTLSMTWVNVDNPSESIECPWYSQGVDIAGEKGVGKALTYGEKYFILKFFNIPTDKDDPDAFQKKFEQKASKEMQAKIRDTWSTKLGLKFNLLEHQCKTVYGCGVAQLSEGAAEEFLTMLESRLGDQDGA
ncbi:ERF family protein [Paenibacillus macerans]|uniref:ERF family protein n=1 Tax=Paenibacillus macerans TaxID=44252 RepID=UPI00203E633F|nr:ERF family protein [Paenibacillus macerans]MCM3701872.1 ERF family protein [Paenibacillus macerans]